ncbi:MAG: DEAD/DEAH box helicase family protein [Bryobacteraceae bacterium]
MAPEQEARAEIDKLLAAAGWSVQPRHNVNLTVAQGVAICEYPLKRGHGVADYLLYVDGAAVGVIEAKKAGDPLTAVEIQTAKYSEGLPDHIPAPRRPLPFCYQSTRVETRFTNLLEPDARSRGVFAFHKPETFSQWIQADLKSPGSTVRGRLRVMPPLDAGNLWPAQIKAIRKLEESLADNRPRALIQMATGSGKTFTACNFIYRLIKFAGAKRVLFLVDRKTLGRQTLNEFQQFVTPDDGRKFTELYNAQLLSSNKIDLVSKLCITTIQRLYSMLVGRDIADTDEEEKSAATWADMTKLPDPIEYNPAFPIETFDFIVTDECHRSIYNLWRQVLEYFDASLIGLTATPSRQTLGFFNRNLVMDYSHTKAVEDKVNVEYDIYEIRTQITQSGSRVDAGFYVDKRDRLTRARRAELLDQELAYTAGQLDRDVVSTDQIRTVIRTFKEKLFTEIFPGRTHVPKTLIFAKDDNHADDIVQIVREEFGKGNDFCQKVTYRTGARRTRRKSKAEDGSEIDVDVWEQVGEKAESVIQSFRNSYNPRIAVTVDMIATGTDIRPLEIVMFLREVRSPNLFEQMKGRGVRVIKEDDLQSVAPDAKAKTHFVIVDPIGVCEHAMVEAPPLDRNRNIAFEELLEAVGFGSTDPEVLSTLASRLTRLDRQLSHADQSQITEVTGGESLADIVRALADSVDPDVQLDAAKVEHAVEKPTPDQIATTAQRLRKEAVQSLLAPKVRNLLTTLKSSYEQTIDTVSEDRLLHAGYSGDSQDKAEETVQSFRQFLEDNKDQITALQILYSRPWKTRLTYKQVKELAAAIQRPHPAHLGDRIWMSSWSASIRRIVLNGKNRSASAASATRTCRSEISSAWISPGYGTRVWKIQTICPTRRYLQRRSSKICRRHWISSPRSRQTWLRTGRLRPMRELDVAISDASATSTPSQAGAACPRLIHISRRRTHLSLCR